MKAEGSFQWAAVASQLVLDPPERFAYDEKACIKYLAEPSTNSRGQDMLDEFYKEVLEGYFKEQEERDLFRSVVGQLITPSLSAHLSLYNDTPLTTNVVMPPLLGYSVTLARC